MCKWQSVYILKWNLYLMFWPNEVRFICELESHVCTAAAEYIISQLELTRMYIPKNNIVCSKHHKEAKLTFLL